MGGRGPVLTYANVVATLALFLVLTGGAAFAVAKLDKGSVGTRQLRAGAVTTAKLKNGAVTAAKIRDGAIGGAKLDLGSIGTVPSARQAARADTAGRADSAGHADSANRADTAGRADSAATADSAKTATSAADAATLAGIGPQAFTRQASSATNSIVLLHTSGTAREVTVDAPRDGYLLAIASADVLGLLFGTETVDYYSCYVIFEGSPVQASERFRQLDKDTQTSDECATNAMLPVTAGTHNVRFAFAGIGPTTQVDRAELDVVFVPFAM